MIIVTGANGFIGSMLIRHFNIAFPEQQIVPVDNFENAEKWNNLRHAVLQPGVHRNSLFEWLSLHGSKITAIFHLGARTDTTEFDADIFEVLNVNYSKKLWHFCTQNEVPFYYASSAATYGGGELGYKDDLDLSPRLQPLNPYGKSKNDFDIWASQQTETPPVWIGLKFFNVFGPHEYHKKRMASVHFHFFNQIHTTQQVNLFKSHRSDIADGEQMRDFIYVFDVVKMFEWLYLNIDTVASDVYNLGTGQARSYNDLAKAIFKTLNLPERINYIPIPEDIRASYQYYTQANMDKIRHQGFDKAFYTLEAATEDYIENYLNTTNYY